MTEMRHGAATRAVTPPSPRAMTLRPALLQGGAGLILGGALTAAAMAWSQGVLGFLGLVTVLGSLGWISLCAVRHVAARWQRT